MFYKVTHYKNKYKNKDFDSQYLGFINQFISEAFHQSDLKNYNEYSF